MKRGLVLITFLLVLFLAFGSGSSELKTLVEGYQMTAGGPRKLGQGSIDAAGGKIPGGAVSVAALLVTHNPVGLAVQTGVQGYGELEYVNNMECFSSSTLQDGRLID